jgi:SRSO17 transposase
VIRGDRTRAGDWERDFEQWLTPFLAALGHKTRKRWAPIYLRGLLAPGERKSIEPLAARVSPNNSQQLHHFVAVSKWDASELEQVLFDKADALIGGGEAHLIVDDTALLKKGRHSVGAAQQYCGQLGKNANCQALVSLTLARDEVPVPIVLRLYLPESWADDAVRRAEAGVPEDVSFRPKWKIALDEVKRVIDAGVRFGDVLADAGYGGCGEFRRGLTALGLTWAVGISADQLVYRQAVRVRVPRARPGADGRPRTRPSVSTIPRRAKQLIALEGEFETITWRMGTKKPLRADFAAARVRVGDGAKVVGHRHGPGDEAWLVCERRGSGEKKYYLTNHTADAAIGAIAASIKARWSCEQAHQQLKEELGLDHFEGRSWNGLTHHALLTMIAFAFLQHLRVRENKAVARESSAPAVAARNPAAIASAIRRA